MLDKLSTINTCMKNKKYIGRLLNLALNINLSSKDYENFTFNNLNIKGKIIKCDVMFPINVKMDILGMFDNSVKNIEKLLDCKIDVDYYNNNTASCVIRLN